MSAAEKTRPLKQPATTPAHLAIQQRLFTYLREANSSGSNGGNTNFDLNTVFPQTDSAAELLMQIDTLKQCLDSFRPFSTSEAKSLADAFDLEYTYESNRIEGNSLTLAETQVVLEKGITVNGKPLIHHLEAFSHRDALIFIKQLISTNQPFTPSVLLEINRIILKGSVHEAESGRFRQRRVTITGSQHIPPNYMVVPDKMAALYADLAQWLAEGVHPVQIAADLHFQLVKIHPFIDGNGRSSRLVMSLWLMKHGYTIANLSGADKDRIKYYDALERASVHDDLEPFRMMVYERAKASLIWHIDGLTPVAESGRGLYYLETIAHSLL